MADFENLVDFDHLALYDEKIKQKLAQKADSSDLGSYVTETELDGKGYQTAADVDGIVDGKGYQTESQVDAKISAAKVGLYNVKGSVASYSDLPADAATGDVYNVIAAYSNTPAGTNYVKTDDGWDALGGTVDVSGFVETSDITIVTNAQINSLFE